MRTEEIINYYDILGIDPSIEYGSEEIKKAYRTLAKQYHPDSSTEENANSKFQQIQEAYETLSDNKKRRDYDRLTGYNPTVNKSFGFGGFSFNSIFEDVIKSHFGQFSQMVQINFNVSLKDIYFGKKIEQNLDLGGMFGIGNDIKVKEEIIIEPRRLMNSYKKNIAVNKNVNVIIDFIPKIFFNTSEICSDLDCKVIFDNELNINLDCFIPFNLALTGGIIKKNIWDKEIELKVPKLCNYNTSTEKKSLSLLENTNFKIVYKYKLPNLSDSQINKVVKAIS